MNLSIWIRRLGLLAILGLGTTQAAEPSAEDYYYGFGVEQDYDKAYEMFKKHNNIPYLVMMHINGDGRPKDLDRAEQIFKDGIEYCSHPEVLEEEIETRKNTSEQEQRRLTLCDLAYTTLDMNHCRSIENMLAEKEHLEVVAKVSKSLSPKGQELLKKIEQHITQIQRSDSSRIYLIYIDGSIRNIASSGTEGYIKERHQKRIKTFLMDRTLTKHSDSDLQSADKKLNEVYQQQRKNTKDRYQEELETDRQRAEEYRAKENMEDKLSDLKNAQLAWIKYRDLWAELLLEYRPSGFENDADITTSIKTILTNERTAELTYDPVGPG